jgi:hypothetical protein
VLNEFTIDKEFDLRLMSKEELGLVPFDKMEWCCQGKNCNRKTTVKTYGDFPFFYWRGQWIPFIHESNIPTEFFMCSKHFKMWKGLIKNYEEEKVFQKVMKPYAISLKESIITL